MHVLEGKHVDQHGSPEEGETSMGAPRKEKPAWEP